MKHRFKRQDLVPIYFMGSLGLTYIIICAAVVASNLILDKKTFTAQLTTTDKAVLLADSNHSELVMMRNLDSAKACDSVGEVKIGDVHGRGKWRDMLTGSDGTKPEETDITQIPETKKNSNYKYLKHDENVLLLKEDSTSYIPNYAGIILNPDSIQQMNFLKLCSKETTLTMHEWRVGLGIEKPYTKMVAQHKNEIKEATQSTTPQKTK